MEHIGKVIKKYRTSKGFSQAQLAKKVGIDRTTLAKYESEVNQPPFDVVMSINEVLKVNMIDEYFNRFLLEKDVSEKLLEYLCKINNCDFEEYEYEVSSSGREKTLSYNITRFSKEEEKELTFRIEASDFYKMFKGFIAHMSIEFTSMLDDLEENGEYGTEE